MYRGDHTETGQFIICLTRKIINGKQEREMSEIASALKNWIPFRLSQEKEENVCQWLYTADKTFDEPFFDETISKCRQLKENSQQCKAVSSLSVLPEWAPLLNCVPPKAIIFHVSRCGSTLLSQLLSLDPANIALSEVPFFDDLLRHGFRNNSLPEMLPVVKAAISFHGVKKNEKQQRLYIKADSWHIHFYDQWRQLYPAVPVILLYRRPDEVIRSHRQHRGMQAVQGVIEPSLFGFGPEIFTLPLDEYMARVLETFFIAFEKILRADKNVLAVNYNEGMLTVMNKIASFTGISYTEEVMLQMKERLGYHAKFPGQVFEEAPLNAAIPAYQKAVFELYKELDSLRK